MTQGWEFEPCTWLEGCNREVSLLLAAEDEEEMAVSDSAWLADSALQWDWAVCPALVWEGVSSPSLLGQGVVWGEGKQSWHRTIRRCSISVSSLHCAQLLLGKSILHSLTHCLGSSQLEILVKGGSYSFCLWSTQRHPNLSGWLAPRYFSLCVLPTLLLCFMQLPQIQAGFGGESNGAAEGSVPQGWP